MAGVREAPMEVIGVARVGIRSGACRSRRRLAAASASHARGFTSVGSGSVRILSAPIRTFISEAWRVHAVGESDGTGKALVVGRSGTAAAGAERLRRTEGECGEPVHPFAGGVDFDYGCWLRLHQPRSGAWLGISLFPFRV